MKQAYKKLGDLLSPAAIKRAGGREYPILSITMHSGLIDQSKKFKKRVASKDTSQYRVVNYGQLVVGFPIDEGLLSFQRLHPEAAVSPAYGIWDCTPDIEQEYLEFYLRSPQAISYYKAKMKGSTARRRNLTKSDFLDLPVPIFPTSEQKRTVDSIKKTRSLQMQRRNSIDLLDELTQSIFLDMFGDPGTNSKGWPLSTIGELIDSAQYGTSQKASFSDDLPVLRMNNITASGRMDLRDLKYLPLDETKEQHLVREGDILFNRTNSPELVGKTAVYRGPEPMAYAGYLIRLRPNPENTPEYISSYLNSRYGKLVLRNMCKSIIGMANINAKELRFISLPKPPLQLQKDFVGRLRKIDEMRARHQTHLAHLDELFASVQQRAFDGTLWDDPAMTS